MPASVQLSMSDFGARLLRHSRRPPSAEAVRAVTAASWQVTVQLTVLLLASSIRTQPSAKPATHVGSPCWCSAPTAVHGCGDLQ